MLEEVMHVVDRVPAGVFIDATVGGGGHSEAILSRRHDLKVFALDRDSLAINSATAIPSSSALCASIGPFITSPIAYILLIFPPWKKS